MPNSAKYFTYLAHASGTEKSDFLKEIELLKKIAEGNNPHVVNMLGCVTIQEPLVLITEFVEYGDLHSYLTSCRKQVGKVTIISVYSRPCYYEYNTLYISTIEPAIKTPTHNLCRGI